MEDITCVTFNESLAGSEFADKEEGKNTEFLAKLGEDILGMSPAEEGGENGEKTIRYLFVRCLYTEWTRNWSHTTKHGCRFDKRASQVRLHCLTNPGLLIRIRYPAPAAIPSQALGSTRFRPPVGLYVYNE